jgi:diguanylate cyclase (GGDEF)-like protein
MEQYKSRKLKCSDVKVTDVEIKGDSFFTVTVMVQTAIALLFAFYYYFSNDIGLVGFYLVAASFLLFGLALNRLVKCKRVARFLVVVTLFSGFLYSLTLSFSALSLAWCLSTLRTLMAVCHSTKTLKLGVILLCFAIVILFSESTLVISSPYSTAESLQFLFLCAVTAIFVFDAVSSRSKYAHNIESLSSQVDQIKRLDALTGLHNRQSIEYHLQEKYAEEQSDGQSFGVILADLDNFKTINERYGHSIGDNVLFLVGQLLNDSLAENYSLGRWVGNTFVIIIPHDEPSASAVIAEVLRIKVGELQLDAKGVKFKLSMSIGIASTSRCRDLNDLISCAENSLYQAKNMGGNMAIAS